MIDPGNNQVNRVFQQKFDTELHCVGGSSVNSVPEKLVPLAKRNCP